MMCIGKVKQWCVHIAILPAQGAPRKKKQWKDHLDNYWKCLPKPGTISFVSMILSKIVPKYGLKGKSSRVLKEYFTSPVSTSKSQSTSTLQEFTPLLHDAWQGLAASQTQLEAKKLQLHGHPILPGQKQDVKGL